ncbi:MAG: hypothetical protein A2X17_03500 [Bacteroidetes bacterium GWF2_41_61]|jgi:hypothetical protein|nr:MAG: hypothetical protein A2X20_11055 [Bacteroidetes bacterium GWE2_40_15]OFY29970.1 MAG: hypothetical protein A2X17_03500 [Bacteroidetes bacterium GWF2_41_61]PKP07243.1 MAG: hypothetical protein CVU10_06775 [Bacteroidetes bacterium HGW-Bacteroidetes-5]HBG24658.1 hypothetical protein [Rikenellaceae bacterium]HBZ26332.1 hypothetical protein [Rikenellaceae bacterium]
MKTKNIVLIILISTLGLLSCIKQNLPDPGTTPEDKTKLADAKVPDSFNWSTSKNVEVSITGLPTVVPIKNTLTITLPDGSKLYNAYHDMSVNLKLTLVVPATVTQLKLKFGTYDETLNIANNKAAFSFIPVVTYGDGM